MSKPPTRKVLEARVKQIGFDNLHNAVSYLEALENKPRVEQPKRLPEPRVR